MSKQAIFDTILICLTSMICRIGGFDGGFLAEEFLEVGEEEYAIWHASTEGFHAKTSFHGQGVFWTNEST